MACDRTWLCHVVSVVAESCGQIHGRNGWSQWAPVVHGHTGFMTPEGRESGKVRNWCESE